MNHTPGPWLVQGRTVFALNEQGTNRFDAHVQSGRVNGELVQQAELLANARLIAAAPDMLAALLELSRVVGDHVDSMTDGAPLHAAFLNAVAAAGKALPPPQQLRNVVEVTIPHE